MKYQVGDKVLVLHSNEEGEIVDFINDKMAIVDVRGVRFPVYLDQVEFPYFKRFTEKKKLPVKKDRHFVDDLQKEKPTKEQRVADGTWLTFLPVLETDEFGDEVVSDLKLHLLNRTNDVLDFVYTLQFFGKNDFELKNRIHPFEDFYLHDIPFSDLNDSPGFHFEFSLPTPDKKRATHFEAVMKLRPKQYFTRIDEIRKKNEASFSHRLFEVYPERQAEERVELGSLANRGFKIYNAKEARAHLEPARSVVDLHIEKISNDWQHLSNFEILTHQLQTFEKYYDLALAHRLPSFTVIHGVGEGKLRDEIHDILRMKRDVKSFVNQYDPRYGYGATEIWLNYRT